MSSSPVTTKQSDEISLRQVIGAVVNNWRIVAIMMGLCIVGSTSYTLLAAPVYQSDVLVQVEQHAVGIQQTLAAQFSGQSPGDLTEIALLTSRMVVGAAVNDLRLYIDAKPRYAPVIGHIMARRFTPTVSKPYASALFGMRQFAWGGESIQVDTFDVPDTSLGESFVLIARANGIFTLADANGNKVLDGRIGKTARAGNIAIRILALQAAPGTQFVLKRYLPLTVTQNLRNGGLVTTEQGKDSGIISLSYQNENPQLANAILRVISDTYVKQNIDRSAAEAAKSLQFVRGQLPKVKADLERSQAALTRYQGDAHFVDLSIETKALLDQIVAIDTNMEQVKLQKVDVATRFQESAPALRAINAQMGELERKKAALQKQMAALPDKQQELLQYTRDVEVNTQIYTALLTQAQQLDVASAGTIGNVRVVDAPAVDITRPVKPRRLLIVAGGVLGGFLLSGIAVFVRQMFNRGVEDPATLEELGITVYAEVPLSKERAKPRGRQSRQMRPMLVAVSNPADLAVEALRSLRTSLHFVQAEAGKNVLMITGLTPGVGKTFVSSNLAVVIAQSGKRVLLINADMRRGRIHEIMGVRPDNGLSDLIAGQAKLDEVIHRGCNNPNLDFIARGKILPNPSELLMHPDFKRLLDEVSGKYDLVIIDTPPVLAVADAQIIGSHAGTSLMVVRFGCSTIHEIQGAWKRLEAAGVPIKGVVFNAIEQKAAGYMGYGYYRYDLND